MSASSSPRFLSSQLLETAGVNSPAHHARLNAIKTPVYKASALLSLRSLFPPCSNRPRTTKLLVGIPPLLRTSRSNPTPPRRSAPSSFSQSFPQDLQLLPDLISPFIPKQTDDLNVARRIPPPGTLRLDPANSRGQNRARKGHHRLPRIQTHLVHDFTLPKNHRSLAVVRHLGRNLTGDTTGTLASKRPPLSLVLAIRSRSSGAD
jgi:hypothetical protein